LGGKHHLVEQDLHIRYGDVVRTGPTTLSFATLPAFEAIYGYNAGIERDIIATGASSVFSAPTREEHRRRRRALLNAAFATGRITSYEPVIAKHAAELQHRLLEAIQGMSASRAVNIATFIHRYTFDTTIDVVFGPSISPVAYTDLPAAKNVLQDYRAASKWTWATLMLPSLRSVMSTAFMQRNTRRPKYDANGLLIGVGALVARSRQLVCQRPNDVQEQQRASIARNLLISDTEASETTKHLSDPAQVWGECFNLTFAGPGSTAAALTAVLFQLGNPVGRKWQRRIRLEMQSEGAKYAGHGRDLKAVIKETLRLHAPFPSGFPRKIMPGGGSVIPGLARPLPVGTIVYANTWVVGRSKELWGADAEDWKPERWLADRDQAVTERIAHPQGDIDAHETDGTVNEGTRDDAPLESISTDLDRKFVAFSKGPRSCIGRDIALRMIERAVWAVLDRWEVVSFGELTGSSWLDMQYEECLLELWER